MKTLLLCIPAAVAVLLLPPAAEARSCGGIGGEGITATNIQAENLRCSPARRVARTVSKVPSFGGCVDAGVRVYLRKPCTRLGYRCVTVRRYSQTSFKVRCSRGRAHVRFVMY